MLHRHRVILKRGMQIGLAEMPGVTGFGEERKIREACFPHDLSSTLQIIGGIRAAKAASITVRKNSNTQADINSRKILEFRIRPWFWLTNKSESVGKNVPCIDKYQLRTEIRRLRGMSRRKCVK